MSDRFFETYSTKKNENDALDAFYFMCDAHTVWAILLHGKKKSLEDSDASPGLNIKKVE